MDKIQEVNLFKQRTDLNETFLKGGRPPALYKFMLSGVFNLEVAEKLSYKRYRYAVFL